MNPETIFEKTRSHFGGDGANPVYDDVLLLSYLNDWIRDVLSNYPILARVSTNKAFTGVPSSPPVKDDYSMGGGTTLLEPLEVTWGTARTLLPMTSLKTLLSLAKAPLRDLGTPNCYWVDFGTTTAITTPQKLIHPYPVPNVSGSLYLEGIAAPSSCTANTAITFPEEFAEAAEWHLVYRWRSNDEDYTDQDRVFAEGMAKQRLHEALQRYLPQAGPQVIRQRVGRKVGLNTEGA